MGKRLATFLLAGLRITRITRARNESQGEFQDLPLDYEELSRISFSFLYYAKFLSDYLKISGKPENGLPIRFQPDYPSRFPRACIGLWSRRRALPFRAFRRRVSPVPALRFEAVLQVALREAQQRLPGHHSEQQIVALAAESRGEQFGGGGREGPRVVVGVALEHLQDRDREKRLSRPSCASLTRLVRSGGEVADNDGKRQLVPFSNLSFGDLLLRLGRLRPDRLGLRDES